MFNRNEFLNWAAEAQRANTHGTDYKNSLRNPALNMHVDNTPPEPIEEEIISIGFDSIPKPQKPKKVSPKKVSAVQRVKEMARKQL